MTGSVNNSVRSTGASLEAVTFWSNTSGTDSSSATSKVTLTTEAVGRPTLSVPFWHQVEEQLNISSLSAFIMFPPFFYVGLPAVNRDIMPTNTGCRVDRVVVRSLL